MLKKLQQLGGKSFLGDEIDNLASEVLEKRFIQGAISLSALVMGATALFAPMQPKGWRLAELGLASTFGFAGAAVARMRDDSEIRYESNVDLNREVYKSEVKARYAKEEAMTEVNRETSFASALDINGLPLEAQLQYAQRYGIPTGLFIGHPDAARMMTPVSSDADFSAKSLSSNLIMGVAKPDQNIVDSITEPTVKGKLLFYCEQYPDLFRLDNNWIMELAQSSMLVDDAKGGNYHYMITGGTGDGKSILGGVLARLISMLSASPATVAGHDPKKKKGGSDRTKWVCKFTDTYKLDGYESGADWLGVLNTLCDKQNALYDEQGSVENLGNLIILQDELNTVYGEGKGFGSKINSELAKELQTMWLYITTNMRDLKTNFIGMGQFPQSTYTGLNKAAMKNVCFIALGSTASYVLNPINVKLFIDKLSEEKVKILQTATEFLADAGVRFALVVPTNGLPYVTLVPEFDVKGLIDGDVDNSIKNYMSSQLETGEDNSKASYEQIEAPEIEDTHKTSNTWLGIPKAPDKPEVDNKVVTNRQQVYLNLKKWVDACLEKFGKYPPSEDIRKAWNDDTGESLSDEGLEYLLLRLGIK